MKLGRSWINRQSLVSVAPRALYCVLDRCTVMVSHCCRLGHEEKKRSELNKSSR